MHLGKQVMKKYQGFTLIELMIVMSMIALILTIAMPRYFQGLKRAKEAVLQEDLSVMRKAIDDYYADKNVYPTSISSLVEERYIKFIPEDPFTQSDQTWIEVHTENEFNQIYDVRSGSEEVATNGTTYQDW